MGTKNPLKLKSLKMEKENKLPISNNDKQKLSTQRSTKPNSQCSSQQQCSNKKVDIYNKHIIRQKIGLKTLNKTELEVPLKDLSYTKESNSNR